MPSYYSHISTITSMASNVPQEEMNATRGLAEHLEEQNPELQDVGKSGEPIPSRVKLKQNHQERGEDDVC